VRSADVSSEIIAEKWRVLCPPVEVCVLRRDGLIHGADEATAWRMYVLAVHGVTDPDDWMTWFLHSFDVPGEVITDLKASSVVFFKEMR
jgi:hypothetical protein